MIHPTLRAFVAVSLLILCYFLPSHASAQPSAKPEPGRALAFVHVNVIPMDKETVLENQTVVVAGGKIVAVGPATKVTVPKGARKVEGSGKYLIPGLTDAHVHLQTPIEFPVFLANGVSTVFNLDGRPAHLLWRSKIAKGEMLGPTIFTTGPIFFRGHKADEAVKLVDEQAELGYDAVKIYNGVSKEEYPELIAEAKKKHMLLMGHVARGPDFAMTLAAGQSIAHMEEYTYTFFNPQHDDNNSHIVYDESRIPEAVRMTAESGIYVIPTLSTYETIVEQATALDDFLKNPDIRYDPPWIQADLQPVTNRYKNSFTPESYPRIRTSLALQRKLLKALEDANVPLMCGTDASDVGPVAGFGIHVELQEYVNDGLTAFQALQTATVIPARYFGKSNEFGTIEAGKRADFVLLQANPLANIGNTRKIEGVMVRGRWLGKEELSRALKEVPATYVSKIQEMQNELENNLEKALPYLEENDPLDNLGGMALEGMVTGSDTGKLHRTLGAVRAKHPGSGLASEQSMNQLGYGLLAQKKYAESIAVFRMNTEDFPKSANTWDSLGEAQFKSGDVRNATESYKKALQIDPAYPNAEAAKKFITEHEAGK
jgi:imidazolonepropionase-like amidohydrolase